jgi:hypothetical protein
MSPSFRDYTDEEKWCPNLSALASGDTSKMAGFSELT